MLVEDESCNAELRREDRGWEGAESIRNDSCHKLWLVGVLPGESTKFGLIL